MKLGFVFPGQGSQSVGMVQSYDQCNEVKHAVDQLSSLLGIDYATMIESGSAEDLAQTIHTQPVLLAMGVGVFREIKKRVPDLTIHAMAGHSLGEYSALVAAESIEFEDAIRAVHQRAQFMQNAVPTGTGAMAAILGLNDTEVDTICAQIAKPTHWVQAANYNSPGQVVIAGHTGAVNEAIEALKTAGAKRTVLLPVSVPSHTTLMKSAAEKFAETLRAITIKAPSLPVWQNATLNATQDPEAIRTALIAQLYSPVCWTQLMQKLAQQGIQQLVECGPGKILWGLNRRATEGLSHASLHDTKALQNWQDSLSNATQEPSI